MTTIAWDGKTLAADKQATFSDRAHSVTKIHRGKGRLYGFSGTCELKNAWINWHQRGADPDKCPKIPDGLSVTLIVITQDGAITLYCDSGNGSTFDKGQPFAIGSGQDYAMAAMVSGANARQAVLLASELDLFSGLGVDSLEL